jgi:hypothetical protein
MAEGIVLLAKETSWTVCILTYFHSFRTPFLQWRQVSTSELTPKGPYPHILRSSSKLTSINSRYLKKSTRLRTFVFRVHPLLFLTSSSGDSFEVVYLSLSDLDFSNLLFHCWDAVQFTWIYSGVTRCWGSFCFKATKTEILLLGSYFTKTQFKFIFLSSDCVHDLASFTKKPLARSLACRPFLTFYTAMRPTQLTPSFLSSGLHGITLGVRR